MPMRTDAASKKKPAGSGFKKMVGVIGFEPTTT
jgi:hypothetical protein